MVDRLVMAAALALWIAGCHEAREGANRVANAACDTDDNCASGLACSDGACRPRCASNAECDGKACVAGGCRDEVCNFRDDDGNGEVDEGFDWVVDAWDPPVVTGLYGAGYPQLATLSTGEVALTVADGYGGGHDRVGTMLLHADGSRLAGPVFDSITLPGAGSTSLTEGPAGEIGIGITTTDYTKTCAPCVGIFVRRAVPSLSRLSTHVLDPGVPSQGPYAATYAAGTYALMLLDGDRAANRLIWTVDGASTVRQERVAVASSGNLAGTLLPDGSSVVWMQASEDGHVSLGRSVSTESDASFEIELTAFGHGGVNVPRNLARIRQGIAAAWSEADAMGRASTQAAIVSEDGTFVVPARPLTALGASAPQSVVAVEDNLVFLGTDDVTVNRIVRTTSSLTVVRSSSGALELGVGSQHVAMTFVGDHLLVARGYGPDDTNHVHVTRVHCP